MRPSSKAAGIAVIVVAVIIVAMFIGLPFLRSLTPDGFEKNELRAPAISYDPVVSSWTNWPEASRAPGKDMSMRWWVTPAYSEFGGIMNITIENTGSTKLHVYRIGLEWPDHDLERYRDINVNISAGSSEDLGVLVFPAPSHVTEANYVIVIYLAAMARTGGGWWDYGAMPSMEYTMEILSLGEGRSYEVTSNPVRFFEKVNSRVDFGDVQTMADGLKGGYQAYDIQQVIAAFDWIRENIVYVDDPNDIWQSPTETISLGGGDCEDQAMLMASLVGALGGNARVNLIEGHAFTTVYVGPNASVVDGMIEAVSSHYGMDLKVFYLEDSYGIWMIVDTTSYQYCGGMPTLSLPTGIGPNDFAFEKTDWLYTIDAVG